MSEPLLEDNCPESLPPYKQGVREYMSVSKKWMCCMTCDNKMQACVKVAFSVFLAVLNLGTGAFFVLESCFGLGLPSEAAGDWLFKTLLAIVAWTEFLALLAYCIRATLIAIVGFISETNSDMHRKSMMEFAYCLGQVGNFSLMRFLCVPSKCAYWYNNSHFFLDAVFNQPVCQISKRDYPDIEMGCRNHVQFSPWNPSHRSEVKKKYPRAHPLILVGWICLNVFFPLAIVWCVVFSVPAAALKMASMPRNFRFDTWKEHEFFKFFGVLNQFSAIWSTQAVENIAVLRFVTMARRDFQQDRGRTGAFGIPIGPVQRGKSWHRCLERSVYEELHWWRGVSLMSVLDSGAMGKILNKGFGGNRGIKSFNPLNDIHTDWYDQ